MPDSLPPLINKSIPFSKSNSGILCDHRQAGRLRRNNEVKFTSKSNIKTKPKEIKNIYKYISVFFTYFCFTFCSFYVISYACLTWKKGNIYSRFRHKQPFIPFNPVCIQSTKAFSQQTFWLVIPRREQVKLITLMKLNKVHSTVGSSN